MRLIPKDDNLGWTPYAWTIYVTFFLISPGLSKHPSAADWLISIGGTIAILALYFRGHWVRGARVLPIIGGLTLIGVVLLPLNTAAAVALIYASSFAAHIDNDRHAAAIISAIEIILIAEIVICHINPVSLIWAVVFVALVGAIGVHFEGVARSTKKLRLAHDEIEHLAKVAERERIARDLHDLLGHTLSVIVLKSELASKLAERDPERARNEIRDVERISRDALTQVRAAVRGYRSGGLQAEIESARDALDAANVTLNYELPPLQIPAAQEAVLSLAIREGVTNIVRHAHATECRIALAHRDNSYVLTIADNGRGGNEPYGSGLTGMLERIEELRGTLSRDGSHGTVVTITMPVQTFQKERSA